MIFFCYSFLAFGYFWGGNVGGFGLFLFLNTCTGMIAWYVQLFSVVHYMDMCMYVSLWDSSLSRYSPSVHTTNRIVFVTMYSHICKKLYYTI